MISLLHTGIYPTASQLHCLTYELQINKKITKTHIKVVEENPIIEILFIYLLYLYVVKVPNVLCNIDKI